MNSKEFDEIIKNKAQQRQADVPADLWEKITARKKKRKPPFFWLLFLSLLLTGIVVEWKLNKKGSPTVSATEKNMPGNIAEREGGYTRATKNKETIKATSSGTVPQDRDAVSATRTTLADSQKKMGNTGSRSKVNNRNADAFSGDVKNAEYSKKRDLKITAQQLSEPLHTDALAKEEQPFPNHKQATKKGSIKMNILAGETGSDVVNITTDEAVAVAPVINENVTEAKTDSALQINKTNASIVKNEPKLLSDSNKQIAKPVTVAVVKPPSAKSKNGGLKIEFAVTKV